MYEISDIKRKAKQFISKTHIKTNDLCDIKRTIKSLGFKIIEYGRFANSEAVASLINLLQIENLCKQMYAFTYIDDNNRFVFVRSGLNENDEKYVLLHELGHIYLNHLSKESHVLNSTVKYEFEANEFAHFLCEESQKKYNRTISKVCVLISVLIVTGITFAGFANAGVLSLPYSNVSHSDVHMSESDTLSTNDNTELSDYFVTASGKKYHKRDCIIIKDKNNIRHASSKDIKSGNYLPCKVCLPNY